MNGTITRVELAKWYEEPDIPDTAQATLFGEMAKLSYPHIKHYHSDLWRDAIWVQRYVTQPMLFFYGAAEYGTNITTVHEYARLSHADDLWMIAVVHNSGVWAAEIVQLESSDG